MALTLRGTPTQLLQGTAAATVTVPVPTGTVAGDLMFCFIEVRTGTIAAPATGWTELAANPTASESYYVYWKFSNGAEPASYTWTPSASVRASASMVAYQNGTNDWDPADPIESFSNTPYTVSSTEIQSASVTPVNNNSNVFVFAGAYLSGTLLTFTPPVGYTEVTRVGTGTERCQIQISLRSGVPAGATGILSTTISSALTTKHGFAVVLKQPPLFPVVESISATPLSTSTATVSGDATADNGSPIIEKGAVYSSVNAVPTLADSVQPSGATGLGVFTANLSVLAADTLYYARAYATNANGTGYGSVLTFTTFANTPSLTTESASAITMTTATLHGTITDPGQSPVTAHGFVWSSLNTVPTLADNSTDEGPAAGGAYTSNITGLTESTLYYVRAYATNSFGTSYGNVVTFSSANPPPSFTRCTFNLSNVALGNWFCTASDPSLFIDCTFNGGGGHAIRLNTTGTYTLSGNLFAGFDVDGSTGAAIYNDSGGLVTLNISDGGTTPTVRNSVGSSTVVNNVRSLLLTGLVAGSRVAVTDTNGTSTDYSDDIEIAGTTNSGTTFQYDYNWTGTPIMVNIIIVNDLMEVIRFTNVELGENGVSLPIQQQVDRQYDNPI